ncbi:uncharacterized protein [Drosophila pseudoobscura]|uniref:Uncharacterized protein n=1 Tax=Drosophila pseudoobscura pseudoobscura TaxID=46245 RepID=A0A6I8WEL2_DROPS|nr:uncharacterized protein LOC6896839 [Drosophila pseudoobscura]
MCKSEFQPSPRFISILLVLILILEVKGVKYEFLIEDEKIFTSCSNQSPGVFGSDGLFDFSEFKATINYDVITIGGNITSKWDMDPTDLVSFQIALFHYDRGNWLPTIYIITVKDFCKVMYDKNYYWYTYWTNYVINKKDVESRCFMRGTKLLMEEYKLHLVLNIGSAVFSGLYKAIYTIEAYSALGVRRPTSFCFEVRGEFKKVK